MSETKLMPLARTAVSSLSALKRPKVSNVAVSIPIGSAKTRTYGINKRMAWMTLSNDAWRFTNRPRISFSTFPSNSTSVNTATVSSKEPRTWRVR